MQFSIQEICTHSCEDGMHLMQIKVVTISSFDASCLCFAPVALSNLIVPWPLIFDHGTMTRSSSVATTTIKQPNRAHVLDESFPSMHLDGLAYWPPAGLSLYVSGISPSKGLDRGSLNAVVAKLDSIAAANSGIF